MTWNETTPPRLPSGTPARRLEEVPLLGVQTPLAAERHHAGAAVHAARRDPLVAQQGQRLAAAAAEVEHRRSAAIASARADRRAMRSRISSSVPR